MARYKRTGVFVDPADRRRWDETANRIRRVADYRASLSEALRVALGRALDSWERITDAELKRLAGELEGTSGDDAATIVEQFLAKAACRKKR